MAVSLRRHSVNVLKSRSFEMFSVLCVFVAGAVFFTWPLARDVSGSMYGFHGDGTGGIAYYRELAQGGLAPFLPGTLEDWAVPFGRPIQWVTGLAFFGSGLVLWVLALVVGAVGAYALFTIGGYALTGAATFALVRWLGGSRPAGLVAGWAFAFYPFALGKGMGHTDHMQGWVLVVLLWALLWLSRAPTFRRGLIAGAVAVACLTFSAYFILFGAIPIMVVGSWGLVRAWRNLGWAPAARAYSAFLTLPVLATAVLWVLGRTAGAGAERQHAFENLEVYTARPLEYVVPATESPWIGEVGTRWLNANLHNSNLYEARLYVGITVLLLAALGTGAAWRSISRGGCAWRGGALMSLAGTAVLAFIVSLPPRLGVLGVSVPMPSSWIFAISPTWRVYSRLVIVVMLCLAVLAASGLDWLRGRVTRTWIRRVASAAVLGLVVMDLWAPWPQPRVTDLADIPSVYRAVANEPDGVVAHYPITTAAQSRSFELLYQDATGKPMINGFLEGSEAERVAMSLSDLSLPSTVKGLQALGVKYVIRRFEGPPGQEQSSASVAPGLTPFARDKWGVAYRVAPAANAGKAAPTSGFSYTEAGAYGEFAWMEGDQGLIRVLAPCRERCTVVVRFRLESYMRARSADIAVSGGDSIANVPVPAAPLGRDLVVCAVVRAGLGSVRLRVRPGAEDVVGADPRRVSVQVSHLTATRATAATCNPGLIRSSG